MTHLLCIENLRRSIEIRVCRIPCGIPLPDSTPDSHGTGILRDRLGELASPSEQVPGFTAVSPGFEFLRPICAHASPNVHTRPSTPPYVHLGTSHMRIQPPMQPGSCGRHKSSSRDSTRISLSGSSTCEFNRSTKGWTICRTVGGRFGSMDSVYALDTREVISFGGC